MERSRPHGESYCTTCFINVHILAVGELLTSQVLHVSSTRRSKDTSVSTFSRDNPLVVSALPLRKTARPPGNRASAAPLNDNGLDRLSCGSGSRLIKPSRSICGSICAMMGFSTFAQRASSFLESRTPSLIAVSTGSCANANPTARNRRRRLVNRGIKVSDQQPRRRIT